MRLTLTPSQANVLKHVPDDWAALPANVCTSALRLMGLLVIRDAPGDRTLNRGFQWRITSTGFRLLGRKIQPIAEPEVLAIHKAAVEREKIAGRGGANQFSVVVPDAVSSALSKRDAALKRRTLVAQRAAVMKAPETIAELIQSHATARQI